MTWVDDLMGWFDPMIWLHDSIKWFDLLIWVEDLIRWLDLKIWVDDLIAGQKLSTKTMSIPAKTQKAKNNYEHNSENGKVVQTHQQTHEHSSKNETK